MVDARGDRWHAATERSATMSRHANAHWARPKRKRRNASTADGVGTAHKHALLQRRILGRMAIEPATSVFIEGKPLTDIWAPPGLRWRARLSEAICRPLQHPYLRFVRNDRNPFDLDNLVYPVLAVSGRDACASIWATVSSGPTEGVWIDEAIPPPPPASPSAIAVRLEQPSVASVAGRPSPPELRHVEEVAPGSPLGLSLAFDAPEVAVGAMSYEGPTKSLIDDLGPQLGTRLYRGRPVSNDQRVKELRITRGHVPGGHGVVVTAWTLEGGPQPGADLAHRAG